MKNPPDQPQDPEPLGGLRVFGGPGLVVSREGPLRTYARGIQTLPPQTLQIVSAPNLVVSGPGPLQTYARELQTLPPRVMQTSVRGIQTLPPRELSTSTGFAPPSGPTVRRGFWAGLWDRFRGR